MLRIFFLFLYIYIKLVKGLEPPTYGLQIRCSTIELYQLSISTHYNIQILKSFVKNLKLIRF